MRKFQSNLRIAANQLQKNDVVLYGNKAIRVKSVKLPSGPDSGYVHVNADAPTVTEFAPVNQYGAAARIWIVSNKQRNVYRPSVAAAARGSKSSDES